MKFKILLISSLFVMMMSFRTGAQVQNNLDFDGSNDYVVANNGMLVPTVNNFTMELWVWPTTTITIQPQQNCLSCISGTSGYGQRYAIGPDWGGSGGNAGAGISVGTNGILVYEHAAGYMPALLVYNAALPAGWNHIAVVYIAKQPRLYLNGTLVATGLTSLKTNIYPSAYFGAFPNYGYFQGKIDDIRIWNVSRTQDQIRSEMHRELLNPAIEANLKLYYKLNQTSGTTVPDQSASGNNGTMTNMDPATDWVASTAPIPYFSIASGNWNTNSTWAAGQRDPVNSWARVLVKNAVTLTANATAEELTIDPSSFLTVNPGVYLTVNSTITNSAGNNGLVIKADGTGMGSLLNNTIAVAGTVETYITANRWHFISTPVTSAVSGIFTGYYLQDHNETSNVYTDIIPVNIPLNVMQGYALWSGTNNTFNYAGTLNAGSQSFGLTRNSQGWNLSGNPYPSSIDWDAAAGWTKTNVNDAVYVENNGGWATYIAGVGTNGGTRYIAPGQGFFVNCNTNPGTLAMTDAVRVHNNTAFFKDEVTDMVRLSVAGNEYTDEMVVRFLGEASEAFDGNYDAYKLASLDAVPELFSYAGTDELSINALPEKQTVQLGFRCQQGGSFTISAAEIRDITNVVLEDKYSGTFTDLNETTYTFTYQTGDDANRFVLHFTPLSIEQQNANPFGVYASGKTIYMNTDQKAQISVFDLLGQQVKSVAVGSGSSSIEMAQSGIYLVRIKSAGQTITTKVNIQ